MQGSPEIIGRRIPGESTNAMMNMDAGALSDNIELLAGGGKSPRLAAPPCRNPARY